MQRAGRLLLDLVSGLGALALVGGFGVLILAAPTLALVLLAGLLLGAPGR